MHNYFWFFITNTNNKSWWNFTSRLLRNIWCNMHSRNILEKQIHIIRSFWANINERNFYKFSITFWKTGSSTVIFAIILQFLINFRNNYFNLKIDIQKVLNFRVILRNIISTKQFCSIFNGIHISWYIIIPVCFK